LLDGSVGALIATVEKRRVPRIIWRNRIVWVVIGSDIFKEVSFSNL
jgi:hypothetical protein